MAGRGRKAARSRKARPPKGRTPTPDAADPAETSQGVERRRRASGKAELRKTRQRRAQRRRLLSRAVIAAAIAAVIGLGGYAIVSYQAAKRIPGVESVSGQSRKHVPGTVSYPHDPPMGGNHSGQPAACGVHDEPVPNEEAVHSLEHGAVWIAYRPGLAADEVAKLERLARGRAKMLVSPYEGLDTPVAITAWGKQLKVDSADDERLARFIEAYRGGGPEPDASC